MLLFSHLSCFRLFVIPWTVARQSPLSSTISQSLFKFMSNESVILSKYLILCCPVLLFLQSFPESGSFPISQLFKSDGQSIGAPASVSVIPINIQGWFPLGLTGLTPCCSRDSQETSPAPHFESISLRCSALFMVQLSHPYMTTWNTIALTRRTFVDKVMPLLFNMLSR